MEMNNKTKYYLIITATCIIASGYFFYVVFTQYTIPPEPPLPEFVSTNFLLAVYDRLGTYSETYGWLGEYFMDVAIGKGDKSFIGFISREEPLTIDFRFCSLNWESKWNGHSQSLTIIITEPHQKYTLYDHERMIVGDPNSYLYWRDTGEAIISTHRPHVELDYDPTHLDIHDEIEIYVRLSAGMGAHNCTLKLKTVSGDEYNVLDTHRDWEQTKRNLEYVDAVRSKNNYIMWGSISLVIGLIGNFVVKYWETPFGEILKSK